MNEKGIEKALKSSEVQRQTAEFSEKKSATSGDLFAVSSNDQQSQQVAPAEISCKERKAGRPKGSKNKSTQEWVEYFLGSVKESPLMFLGKLYAKDTKELAREMCADRLDALKLQISAANAVLPYVHQKQPIAIETGGEELPTIQIFASPTVYNQINNGTNAVKKEIIVDGIASTTAEEISFNNNDLALLPAQESENKV